MGVETILLLIALAFGLYMAWNIGANDVANAMGTSVGSGALTLRRAVVVAAVLEFTGAVLVGSHVSETVRAGIVAPEVFAGNPRAFAYGMMGALLAAGVWLQIASYFGWPVSTTHSIVGSVIGFGAVVGGLEAVRWAKVSSIVASWVISPVLSAAIAFVIFTIIRRWIIYAGNPVQAAKRGTPIIVFFVVAVLTLVMVFKGLKNLRLDLSLTHALVVATLVGLLGALVSHLLVQRVPGFDGENRVVRFQPEEVLDGLQQVGQRLHKLSERAIGDAQLRIESIAGQIELLTEDVKRGVEVERSSREYRAVERIFVYLQILSAAFVAFAHGANDVANAVGPLAAVVSVLDTGIVGLKAAVPLWILALGGVGIVVGLATWGWRVIETIGKRITALTPTRGFSAEFGAATTIVMASKLGLPISTTHTLVGAVLGVGLARGIGALNLRTVRDIVFSWIVTIPAGALFAILFYYILLWIFG